MLLGCLDVEPVCTSQNTAHETRTRHKHGVLHTELAQEASQAERQTDGQTGRRGDGKHSLTAMVPTFQQVNPQPTRQPEFQAEKLTTKKIIQAVRRVGRKAGKTQAHRRI